jgi:hypothetical protein
LEVGDNFVVNVEEGNNKGANFWLVCCVKPLHRSKQPYKCRWGINFDEGDDVVVGKYYRKWGNSNSSYVQLKKFSSCVHVFRFA